MFDTILKYFPGAKFSHVAQSFGYMSQVLELLDDKYIADKDAKNALIDTLIALLQQHKDTQN